MRISDWSSDVCSSDLIVVYCSAAVNSAEPKPKARVMDSWPTRLSTHTPVSANQATTPMSFQPSRASPTRLLGHTNQEKMNTVRLSGPPTRPKGHLDIMAKAAMAQHGKTR